MELYYAWRNNILAVKTSHTARTLCAMLPMRKQGSYGEKATALVGVRAVSPKTTLPFKQACFQLTNLTFNQHGKGACRVSRDLPA